MKTKRVLIALLLLALPTLSLASTWQIDPAHSEVGFRVRHMMIANVKGAFATYSGTVVLDEKDLAKSRVEMSIETNSINTGIQKRDEHLRSGDFFDVAKFPAMTYVSRQVKKGNDGRIDVIGDLTLRGVTREVVLSVEGPTAEIKDPWGLIRRGAMATAKINRKDFGLVWNQAIESGGVVVGDEVTIVLELELVRKG